MATSRHVLAPPPAPRKTRRGTLGAPRGSPPLTPGRAGSRRGARLRRGGTMPRCRDPARVRRGDGVGGDSPQHPQRRAPRWHPGVAPGVTRQPCPCHGRGVSRPGDAGCRPPGAPPGAALPVITLPAAGIFGAGAADGRILSPAARRLCVCRNGRGGCSWRWARGDTVTTGKFRLDSSEHDRKITTLGKFCGRGDFPVIPADRIGVPGCQHVPGLAEMLPGHHRRLRGQRRVG